MQSLESEVQAKLGSEGWRHRQWQEFSCTWRSIMSTYFSKGVSYCLKLCNMRSICQKNCNVWQQYSIWSGKLTLRTISSMQQQNQRSRKEQVHYNLEQSKPQKHKWTSSIWTRLCQLPTASKQAWQGISNDRKKCPHFLMHSFSDHHTPRHRLVSDRHWHTWSSWLKTAGGRRPRK